MLLVLCDYNLHIVASMYLIFFQARCIKFNLVTVCNKPNAYSACADNNKITIAIVCRTTPNVLSYNLAIVCTESNAYLVYDTIDIVHTTMLNVNANTYNLRYFSQK